MSKNTKTILISIGFAALFTVATLAYNRLSRDIVISPITTTDVIDEAENSNNGGEKIKANDFTALDSDGNDVKLSDMFGTPIVLNFWASWCPPCKSEMPEFETVYQEMSSDIAFMMVNLTDGMRETKEKAEEYIANQGFTFPIYFDTKYEAAYAYEISSIPMTLFIDKDGYIRAGVRGAIDGEILRQGLELIQ